LASVSSYRYSGIVHKKTLGVVPAADKKGFTAVLKKGKYAQRPAKNTVRVDFKAGPRRSLKKLKNLLIGSKYRKDLTQVIIAPSLETTVWVLVMMIFFLMLHNQDRRMIVLINLSEALKQYILSYFSVRPILMTLLVLIGCPPPRFRCPALTEARPRQGKEGRVC